MRREVWEEAEVGDRLPIRPGRYDGDFLLIVYACKGAWWNVGGNVMPMLIHTKRWNLHAVRQVSDDL